MLKTLLVVGSAPCLFDDVAEALQAHPDSPIMTINEACGALRHVDHMLAGHTVKAEAFVEYRREKFPDAPPCRVHASWHRLNEAPKQDYPSVTDWWDGSVSTGASSAGKAIRIGFLLGYERIILCGCPMNGGGYFNQSETARFEKAFLRYGKCKRIGDDREQNYRGIVRYRDKFAALAETEWKGRVFSMSGWTRTVLNEDK
jgi:hypothetical protein